MSYRTRHILGLSGGKDSTALAILLHKHIPQMEHFFCDTGKELCETYEYLEKIEARLGIKIRKLAAKRGFDHWLAVYGGVLPSPQVRWCTKQLKIKPLEDFIGNDIAYSYIGIRADEDREGYISTNPNIIPVYPYRPADFAGNNKRSNSEYIQVEVIKELKEQGIILPLKKTGYNINNIRQILNESGIGFPDYYRWRTRSGCYFCFFQRKYEWVKLAEEHPDLFDKAREYEEKHSDGRTFFWNQGESLRDLVARKDQILADYRKTIEREKENAPNKTLTEALEKVLDDEDIDLPCIICNL